VPYDPLEHLLPEDKDRENWMPDSTDWFSNAFQIQCQLAVWEFEDTGNPIFAWFALGQWCVAEHLNKRQPELGTVTFKMPYTLMRYLLSVSSQIQSLAIGVHAARSDADGNRSIPEEPLTPAAALQEIAFALDLKAEGWNAFAGYNNHRTMSDLYRTFREAREQGLSYSAAMERVKDEAGTEDERTARRKMSGERGAEVSPPWRKRAGAKST
jgi:hypothetical protein